MLLQIGKDDLLKLNRAKQAKRPSTTVQTIICSKARFKSRAAAAKWVRDHGFHTTKVDETSTSYRFRQREPGAFTKGSLRTITLTNGVKAVIGKLKNQRTKIVYRVDFIARKEEEQIVTGIVAETFSSP